MAVNAQFTPSRDFNADDVVFTFDRMMNPDNPYAKINGGNYVTFNTKLADILQSVKKIDDYTVAFTLKEPLAPFVGVMAHQSLAITSAEYADVLRRLERRRLLIWTLSGRVHSPCRPISRMRSCGLRRSKKHGDSYRR